MGGEAHARTGRPPAIPMPIGIIPPRIICIMSLICAMSPPIIAEGQPAWPIGIAGLCTCSGGLALRVMRRMILVR